MMVRMLQTAGSLLSIQFWFLVHCLDMSILLGIRFSFFRTSCFEELTCALLIDKLVLSG